MSTAPDLFTLPVGKWVCPERRLAPERPCEKCGTPFRPRKDAVAKGDGRFCSRKCGGSNHLHGPENFITPPSTKAERLRANGLINMRIRRGWLVRPDRCAKCDKKCRTDAHHADYMKPGHVAFVCRSCHQKVHFNPIYLDGVETVDTSLRTPREVA